MKGALLIQQELPLSCLLPRALANTFTTTDELDEKEAFAAACSKSSNSSSSSSSNWILKNVHISYIHLHFAIKFLC